MQVFLNVVLPEAHHTPTVPSKPCEIITISLSIFLDFGDPKRRKVPLPLGETVAMPEIAVDKNRQCVSRKNNIGSPGQRRDVLSKTPAAPEQLRAHQCLEVSISIPDTAHAVATLMDSQIIHYASEDVLPRFPGGLCPLDARVQ